jgi:hypothetical protein
VLEERILDRQRRQGDDGAGGLISYGPDVLDLNGRAAVYVDKFSEERIRASWMYSSRQGPNWRST